MSEGKESTVDRTAVPDQENDSSMRPPLGTRLWRWSEFGKKSGWNWLELLIVPIVLLFGGYVLTTSQEQRAIEAENQRAKVERAIAEQRAQDEALEAYLNTMGDLLLDRHLATANEDEPVRDLAEARTTTVIARLGAEENESVTRFLTDWSLASQGLLREADLRDTELAAAILPGADLTDARLEDANLKEAFLVEADLKGTSLQGADLSGALLVDATLSAADLNGANLNGAKGVTKEQLDAAKSLKGTTMPNGLQYEDWLKSKGSGEDGENSGPS